MRTQPGAEQRPDTLHRIDVHLAEAVAVLVAGILAAAVADRLVPVAPGRQARVDVVFVGVDQAVRGNGRCDHRLDCLLLHIGEHADHELTTALDQTEDRRLVLLQCAPSRRTRQPAASARPPLFATAAGWPLCPSTTSTSSTPPSPDRLTSGALARRPLRTCSVMSCTSEVLRPSSPAICRLDRFRPMKYRHNTQIRSGWWCPASTVPLRSSKRDAPAWQRYRCRCGCVSSCPFRTTASLPHPGQRTSSGQRCWRTKAKHFASSSRDARLTGSTVAMMTGIPRVRRPPSTAWNRHCTQIRHHEPPSPRKPTRASRY